MDWKSIKPTKWRIIITSGLGLISLLICLIFRVCYLPVGSYGFPFFGIIYRSILHLSGIECCHGVTSFLMQLFYFLDNLLVIYLAVYIMQALFFKLKR